MAQGTDFRPMTLVMHLNMGYNGLKQNGPGGSVLSLFEHGSQGYRSKCLFWALPPS